MSNTPAPTKALRRLAIVRQKYNPAGGAERFVSRALLALSQQGVLRVALIARKWEALEGVSTYKLNPFYLGSVWRDWGFAQAAQRLWQKESFDLVQSHERIPGCDIYRAGDGVHRHWLSLRRRQMSPLGKLALWLNPYHHYAQWAEAAMFRHPQLKLVICNSQMVKREIQHYFGLPEQKIAVIYNGVDVETFHPHLQQHRSTMRQQWHIPADAPLLLYVGSGFARKGVARALQALVKCEPAYLLVVGHDKQAKHYQQLAQDLGVAQRVVFAGAQQDVKPFYGMADAFVLPTLYDPFPNVCIEALACGLPVFTTEQCGSAEWIHPGKNGWVHDALDEASLVQHMQTWLQQREQWPQLRQAARDSVASLDLSSMAEQLVQCYQRLLSA